jgi:hypothetical protein
MLEGYKPIDFSGIFGNQPDLSQMRNRVGLSQAAINILANSSTRKTPITSLLASGLNARGEAPPRKQTLWGRTVDLLSTPVYAVANAVDDAIAGHQSDDDDSVLSDAMQIIGGVATGAGRGIGTGLRGAFAPSEIAADPQDKIYLGDAMIRLDTHMSAEEAMKPENLEKVRARLMNKKVNKFSDAEEDKYFYDFEKGAVEVTDEDIQQYFKDMHLYGLGASMVADPLNFIKGPTGVLSGTKGTAEVPEIISGSKNIYEGFKSIPKGALNKSEPLSINLGSMAVGKAPGSYKVKLTPGSVQNMVAGPGGKLIKAPEWFDSAFPASASSMSVTRTTSPVANKIDPLDDILNDFDMAGATGASKTENPITGKTRESAIPVARIPDAQIRVSHKYSKPAEVTKFAGDLLKRMSTGDMVGFANALERINIKHPGVPFTRTAALIEHASKTPDFARRLGIPAERKKIVAAFHRVIKADAASMAVPPKIKPAEQIINDATGVGPIALDHLVAGAKPKVVSRNPARDAKAVNDVYQKFSSAILGTGTPSGLRNPAKWSAAVAAGKNVRYSGPQQAQMWNYITSVLLKNVKTPNRFAKANGILRQVEDMFIANKAIPMSSFKTADSVPLRLSQVLEAIGPAAAAMSPTLLTKILRGDKAALAQLPAEVVQRIEQFKAGESLVDASTAVKGVEAASKNIEDLIKGPISSARTEEIVTIGSKVADDIARAAGGSPVAGSKAATALKDEFLPKAPGDGFSVTNTVALISHPDVSGKLLKSYSSAPSITKAINKAIGGPPPSKLGKLVNAAGARVPEWLGARFNAAYKNADMRPTYLRHAASAKSTVARRAEYLNRLARNYDVNDADLWNDALKGAQGRMEPVPGSQAAQLSQELLKIMEDLFGSSGLKTSVALENSVAGRSQLFMGELNRNLKRFGLGQYQFSRGKKPRLKGEVVNPYWEGTNWLNSWESWNIEKPLEFLFKIQNVVEHTVREKIMFDDIIARWGTYTRAGEFTHTVNSHPRLANVYFGKEAASQVDQFVKNLKGISQTSSKQLQHFDKAVSKWKAAVTIYVPSHHIRNVIGDVYFNWLGGVNSTRPYSTALRVMQAQRGRYEGLQEISALTNPNTLRRVIEGKGVPGAVGKQTALTMKNGTNVTNDMVYVAAFQQGILPTTRVLEDIPDDAITGLERFKPLGGKGQKAAHTISEGRDHYVRLAHFIDQLKKSPKGFEAAVEDAAAVVRKWHPDGMDLTVFERNVMRRMFPFYSWTRKAIPLIVESLVATPGKIMVYPKAQYMLQNMMGIQTGPMSDPFPYDQLFPDWIREKGIGPISSDPYTVLNPGNPTMDTIAQLNNPGKAIMGMLNPAARIPIELSTGREAQTGAPIEDNMTDYTIKQIPGLSHAGRATGEFGVSDTTKELSQGVNWQNIFNMLFGAGIQNTKPYVKSAEFDLRDYLRSQR